MLRTGVLTIVRLHLQQPTDELLDALTAGGVDTVEVTLPTRQPASGAAVGAAQRDRRGRWHRA